MSLTNKSVVVVTGAASGIGRALAVRLSKETIAGIAISDVNEAGLQETAQMIVSPNIPVTTHTVNVADYGQMINFRDAVTAQHQRVTHVVNNAGVSLFGDVEQIAVEDIRWLFEINFWGVVYGTKLFLPILREQPSAHIINMSSIFGILAPPGSAAYSASKFAVRGFTEALRHELQNTNIAVSCVHPGGVKTNIANNMRRGVAADDAEHQVGVKAFNETMAATTAEVAADTIVRGIKARKKRILVGADARRMNAIQRLTPENAIAVIDFVSGGKLTGHRKKLK